MKSCSAQILFLLILLFLHLKCKRSNSQSISVLAGHFYHSFLVHKVFAEKMKFFLLFKNFFRLQKTFSCLKKITFPCTWKNFWSKLQPSKIIIFKRETSIREILVFVEKAFLFVTFSRKVLKAILRESNNITCMAMGITFKKKGTVWALLYNLNKT